MPIIELDLFYAAIDEKDRFHRVAHGILEKYRQRKVRGIRVDALSLHELELNLKAGNILMDGTKASTLEIGDFFQAVGSILTVYRLKLFPLTVEQIIKAAKLRDKFGLSFYDSHHAASALLLDSKIISYDKAYNSVPSLVRIDPEGF